MTTLTTWEALGYFVLFYGAFGVGLGLLAVGLLARAGVPRTDMRNQLASPMGVYIGVALGGIAGVLSPLSKFEQHGLPVLALYTLATVLVGIITCALTVWLDWHYNATARKKL